MESGTPASTATYQDPIAEERLYAPTTGTGHWTLYRPAITPLEQEFRVLAEEWYMDTMPLSSYLEKILHPSYQKILVLGRGVVPFIMNELRDMPNDWFWALRMLTDADPVEPDQAGDMQAMTNAWLYWWENEGSTWQAHNLS